jgi:hypothetical protein
MARINRSAGIDAFGAPNSNARSLTTITSPGGPPRPKNCRPKRFSRIGGVSVGARIFPRIWRPLVGSQHANLHLEPSRLFPFTQAPTSTALHTDRRYSCQTLKVM